MIKILKQFKFTGPTSIGKSFTLFRACHIFYNFVYINLRVLNENKNDLHKCYSIIISELERLDIKKYLEELNNLIYDNYNKNNNFLDLLKEIMKFLKDKLKVVFIFDQFKNKYINDGFIENIKNYENIKYVLCSSINDKNMRSQCHYTWIMIGVNIQRLNKDNQNYFIYFSSILKYERKLDEDNDVIKKLGYLPKYKKLYNENKKKKY